MIDSWLQTFGGIILLSLETWHITHKMFKENTASDPSVRQCLQGRWKYVALPAIVSHTMKKICFCRLFIGHNILKTEFYDLPNVWPCSFV